MGPLLDAIVATHILLYKSCTQHGPAFMMEMQVGIFNKYVAQEAGSVKKWFPEMKLEILEIGCFCYQKML